MTTTGANAEADSGNHVSGTFVATKSLLLGMSVGRQKMDIAAQESDSARCSESGPDLHVLLGAFCKASRYRSQVQA